jgi:hypothetical protein
MRGDLRLLSEVKIEGILLGRRTVNAGFVARHGLLVELLQNLPLH